MSTSDLDKIDAAIATAQAPASLDELSIFASAIPPAAEIARLANEFFKAIPGTSPEAPPFFVPAPLTSVSLAPAAAFPAIASAPGPVAAAAPGQLPSTPQFELPRNVPFAEAPSAAYTSPQLPSFASAQIPTPTHAPLPVATPPFPAAGLPPSPLFSFGQIPSFGFGHALPTEADVLSAFNSASSFYFLNDTQAAPVAGTAPSPVVSGPKAVQAPSSLTGLDLDAGLFDVHSIRRDFPILRERVNGRPLIWLDNAATTQKPQSVIDRISYFYEHENSNIHRAAHELAARATDAYEGARDKVRRFVNASSSKEIVFARGATEAINLVAQSWGRRHINAGDEIVISHLEHHANIVPWQMLCSEKGARLRVIPIDDDGQILLDEYEKLLGPKTRLVSVAQVSNALGTVTPAREIVEIGHRYGARVLIDGAQAISHMPVDVQVLDCDFYVFSGHKMFAPTGIGVLYGKPDALAEMPPWQGGGNMIVDVTFDKTTYQPPPGRFEAGTGSIADAVGLGAAIDYLERIGMHNIAHYEHELLKYGMESLRRVPGLHLIGTAREKASVMSFVLDGYRNEDVGAALNQEGIAVRTGHHCAQPSLCRYGLETAVRPSLALYNTHEEIDKLIEVLLRLKSVG
ncbi:MAG TPA: family 2A encapsulin nanocompartment cargo protein cysteine desulfurase [Silvibacterium sp.]|nr:family 2A encapsulin nanocompartment cargo protein cysteine desulfurase [Silvibacterium sp.]